MCSSIQISTQSLTILTDVSWSLAPFDIVLDCTLKWATSALFHIRYSHYS